MAISKQMFTAADAAAFLTKEAEASTPLSEDDVLDLAKTGALPVCFGYSGSLGIFSGPVPDITSPDFDPTALFPTPNTVGWFSGYLKSGARLERNIAIHGRDDAGRRTSTTGDALTPDRVTMVITDADTDAILLQAIPADHWLGRVAAGRKLDRSHVAESKWRFFIDDLLAIGTPASEQPPRLAMTSPDLDLLPTSVIKDVFAQVWPGKIHDAFGKPPIWLKECRHVPGKAGKTESTNAMWNPSEIAVQLAHGKRLRKHVPITRLNAIFNADPALANWRDRWATYVENFRHLNDG